MWLEDEVKANGPANSDKMTKQLLYLTVISAFISFGRAENCKRGPHDLPRFGPSCEYLCHCGQYECDRITGECPSNVECVAGWMGSGCQYANIAFSTTVESNHLGSRSNVVDGRKITCAGSSSLGDSIAYVTISFGREVKITEANILFFNTAPPFNVSILGRDESSLCGSVNDTSGQKQFLVKCGRPLYGQHIKLTSYGTDARLVLCELQVPAGMNMAYGKPAFQSSDETDYYTADRAVDGNANLAAWETCTHTIESKDPWWLLDLHRSVMIQWFRIYNRKDEPPTYVDLNERLKNFRIFLSLDNATFNEYYQDNSNDTALVIEPILNPEVMARFVKIDLRGDKRILTLCEVQVFGECNNLFYGNCSIPCGHCAEGKPCDKVTGYCDEGGCASGWQTEKCDKPCDNAYYGNCTTKCGHCRNSTVCNKVNGSCPSGQCSEGWKGEKCDTECDSKHYGENCANQCGQCLNETCNQVSGNCLVDAGCQPGWQGSRCDIACANDYYGNCTTKCGHCRNSTVCNKVNGSCPSGQCSEGWTGEKCDTECDFKHYGENCVHDCGHCLNEACNQVSGNCLVDAGCQPGWQGSRCDIVSGKSQQTDSDVGLVGGSVGAAVAIIALIVTIVAIIVLKRRRKTPLSNIPSAKDLASKKEDVVVYESPSFVDINDGMLTVTEAKNESKANTRTSTAKQEKTGVKLNKEDVETYYNVGRTLPKGTIQLTRLWDYIQEKFLDDKYFSEEFEKLPSGPQLPMTVALRSENRNKNRYKQLYAYDVNRVVLNPLSNDDNDYINASFVDGYSGPKMYIASQGTTKDNINDFWRMLWQYDVEKIVMLTGLVEGGRHKCEMYWPEEEGQSSTFGSVGVRLLDTDLFADFDIRTLEMSVAKELKRITQFHYTAWPDKGVPKAASSIVHFWNSVNKVPTNTPIVVHCSAGIGRTGTYISLDYLANQAKVEGQVNVSACVSNLRRQRVNLVQTKEQYIFLHEALVEAMMLSGTATSSDNFPKVYSEILEVDRESGKIKLQLEYERLQNEIVSHETVYATIKMEDNDGEESNSKQDEFSAAKKSENRAKNRYDNILPADRHRVFLSTLVSGRNDYINAVVVPSHRQKTGFILTQMPLNDTVIDFWRMINDFEIRTIIMLNSESSKTHDIGIYWPTDGEVRYGPFSVRLTKQEKHKNYIERTLSFSIIGDGATRDIKQFQFTKWTETADVPENTESFLQLLDAADKWQKEREAKPVVVHCINGAQGSGLYCVISTVIERLMVERDVAISQTIKRIRAIRQQIIPHYEQFRFCHECILQYMKTFETYSNFSNA